MPTQYDVSLAVGCYFRTLNYCPAPLYIKFRYYCWECQNVLKKSPKLMSSMMEDFFKFCGLLRISKLYMHRHAWSSNSKLWVFKVRRLCYYLYTLKILRRPQRISQLYFNKKLSESFSFFFHWRISIYEHIFCYWHFAF